jgi:hypothetical protein
MKSPERILVWLLRVSGAWLLLGTPACSAAPEDYFKIQVLDAATGRGVPLVELRTVNKASWWTDSNGIVAFNEPGLMDLEVYFHLQSPGYEMAADFLGNRGVKLKPVRGGHAEIRLQRLNIAERVYRITGQGIYRDSLLVGHPVPLRQPALNGQVMGQDTVIATLYRGKIHWFWGDTDRASYPLGNFGASGATSELPGRGGLDPGVGVELTYFVDESGFSRPMCVLPGKVMHWIEGPFTVQDERGTQRLVTRVANQAHLGDAESWDLMVFNDEKAVFEPMKHWDIHDPHESAHPFHARADGVEYIYLFPNWRVRADWTRLVDLTNYEALTCVAGDGIFHRSDTEIDRDAAGRPRYSWKAGADRLHPNRVRELISAGKLKPDESWIDLLDFETGERLQAAGGSVCWNDYRQRWVMLNEPSKAGEIWFAEADTPVGPWAYARRVVTHGEYNFYNPTQHTFFDQEGGRLIYFEGTYSDFFSGARAQTPRYDYNQIMYRLTLDDSRLILPVAVYRVRGTNGQVSFLLRDQVESSEAWERVERVAWLALPSSRPQEGVVAFYANHQEPPLLSTTPARSDSAPLFAGLPLVASNSEVRVEGLWGCRATSSDGGDSLNFSLQLSQTGTTVGVGNLGDAITGLGVFNEGKLALSVTNEQKAFSLEARVTGRTLEGTWRENGTPTQGTWSASLADGTPSEWRSTALAVLREYRRAGDDGYDYSIDAQPPRGCSPEGRPICRVWKVPGSVLTFDWKAKPNATR